MSKVAVNPEFEGESDRPQPRPAAAEAHSPLELYKPGRGTYVRWLTAVGAGVLLLSGAAFVYDQLGRIDFGDQEIWRFIIPLVLVVLGGVSIFHVCGRQRKLVDFFIATEDEMRKVNWSTRREVFGATKIVIVVLFAMGFLLFLIDVFFMFGFEAIGVLRVANLTSVFSGGAGQ